MDPQHKTLSKATPSQPKKLFQFGFFQITKQDIGCKASQRDFLHNAIEVKDEQDALKQEQHKNKSEQERYLNQKCQARFRDWQQLEQVKIKAQKANEVHVEVPQVSVLTIAVHSKNHMILSIGMILCLPFKNPISVPEISSKNHKTDFNLMVGLTCFFYHSNIEGRFCRAANASGDKGILSHEMV